MENFINQLRTEITFRKAQCKVDHQAYRLIREGRGDDIALVIEETIFNTRRVISANR
jgi:DNA-binding GntR family transcriptional regulator